MATTTRRSLLRWAALGGAVAACRPATRGEGPFSIALDKPSVPGAGAYGTFEERWLATSCAQCPASCGIRVRVVEGRAVRIEGNPANPLNRGGIGPRGLAGLQALYDADRLTGPMRRDGDRLVAVSWQDALALLVERLRAVSPEKLLIWSGADRGMVLELLARFARVLGTRRFHAGTRPRLLEQAMEEAYGVRTLPAFDWGGARYILSLEAGLLEDSCQSVWFARAAAELRRGRDGARAKIVHVGPVYDLSAHNADEWLQIAPGTSGALALGIARVLIKNGLIAKDAGAGLDAFVAAVEAYDPDTVAGITGLTPSKIERIAAEMGDASDAFAVVDDRSLAFSNGLATAHAALALDAILGAKVGIEPPAPYASWPEPAAPAQDPPDPITPEAIAGAEVALLHRVNPVWARAEPAKWKAALAEVPLVVSFSPFLDETSAEVADLILPDHTYLERWEDSSPAPGTGRVVAGVRRPVIEPLHDTRATGDVIIGVAAALGGATATAFPWASFAEAMEARMIGLYQAQRGSIEARGEREFLSQLYQDGFWADADDPLPARAFRFHPGWTPPSWRGEPDAFPLALVAYRPLAYAEGSGANQPWLRMIQSRPGQLAFTTPATIHPDDAPGLVSGELVTLVSELGSITVPVRIDPHTRPGTIAVPLGGGHTAFGRWAVGVGANVMELLAPGPLCATRVRLERGGQS